MRRGGVDWGHLNRFGWSRCAQSVWSTWSVSRNHSIQDRPELVRDGGADDLLYEPLRADGDGGEGHALDGQRGRRHGGYHRILLLCKCNWYRLK